MGPLPRTVKILCAAHKSGKKLRIIVRNKTVFGSFRCCELCVTRTVRATLKTYPLHIIAEADAVPCVIVFSVYVRRESCIFLFVNTDARFSVFVSRNLHRAYERFINFVKSGGKATV